MQVWRPFSSSIFCSCTVPCRDNITSRERAAPNRFYVVAFNRIQVNYDPMNDPTDPYKRSLEPDDLDEAGFSSKRNTAGHEERMKDFNRTTHVSWRRETLYKHN